MIFETNGKGGRIPTEGSLNIFALVIYIPDPLATFLDDLRRRTGAALQPPGACQRFAAPPLVVDWKIASAHVRSLMESRLPFEIELTEIRTFPATDVIYKRHHVRHSNCAGHLLGLRSPHPRWR